MANFTIYCIGRNYVEHAKELGNAIPQQPVVFLKSAACLRGSTGLLAFADEEFHHEAELVVKLGKNLALGEKADSAAISDIALGLDLTRRPVQTQLKQQGLPWTLAKSFAGSAIVGPFVPAERFNLANLRFSLSINHELKQQGDTQHMLFSISKLVTYLASFNQLVAGDLIYTGTPAGVGPIRRGDHFQLAILDSDYLFTGIL